MTAGDVMMGRRIHGVDKNRNSRLWFKPEPGGYWHDGDWWATTPNGLVGNLASHDVVEHEDGTITVSPSILVDAPGEGTWHGFLEHGVWREV